MLILAELLSLLLAVLQVFLVRAIVLRLVDLFAAIVETEDAAGSPMVSVPVRIVLQWPVSKAWRRKR